MKIGIIADTHLSQEKDPKKYNSLLSQLRRIFNDFDKIIHAGDVCEKNLLHELEKIAPTICVKGEEDQNLEQPEFRKFEAGVYKIGVIHQPPDDLGGFFKEQNIDVLIHGQTHYPIIQGTPYNTLILNPGSPTHPKEAPQKKGFDKPKARKTVLTLQIDEESNMISTYIINLKT
ncbi:MAG: YfcE family phosphodiesterase [Promethearchaeia archaeon]